MANLPSVITDGNGNEYTGETLHGLKHGKGTAYACLITLGTEKWASGASYTGEYTHGKRTGEGEYTWPNRDKYVGQFVSSPLTFRSTDSSTARGRTRGPTVACTKASGRLIKSTGLAFIYGRMAWSIKASLAMARRMDLA